MSSFRRVSLVGLTLLACGPSATPAPRPEPVSIPLVPSATASVAVAPEAPAPMQLPANAAVRASFDVSVIDRPAVRALLAPFEAELVRSGLPLSRDRNKSETLSALGIDGARPVTVALLGYGDASRKRLDALRRLAESLHERGQPNPPVLAKLRSALDEEPWLVAHRVLVPVTDAERFTKQLDELLTREGHKSEGRGLYTVRHAATRVSADAHTVSIDTISGTSDSPKSAFAELDARVREGVEAPVLEGRAARIVFAPPALAYVGFATGLVVTSGALSGDSVSEDQKERIAVEGMRESAQTFSLADFDEVDLRLGLSLPRAELIVRATPGATFRALPEAAWATSPSVEAPGYSRRLELTAAFGRGWPLPGNASYLQRTKEAGGIGGYIVGLPNVLLLASQSYSESTTDALDEAARAGRFERVGVLAKGDDLLFFAVLPERSTRADAQKSVAELTALDARSARVARLKWGPAKIVEVEGRQVILRAGPKSNAALPSKITLAKRGPYVAGLPFREVFGLLGTDAAYQAMMSMQIEGAVTREGKALVFSIGLP